MAILDSLPGVEVTVVVDGVRVQEHTDADMEDEQNTTSKYIEAVTGANFAVAIKATQALKFRGDCLAFYITVDGVPLTGGAINPEQLTLGSFCGVIDGVRVNESHTRKLKFSALEPVNESGPGVLGDVERAKKLGGIQVEIFHKKKIGLTRSMRYTKPVENKQTISEKAIKGRAMSHSYSLDKEVQSVDFGTHWLIEPIRGIANPAGTFFFHYRSKASLNELLIIPRSPSPIPLEDRPEEGLSREEMTELLRQYKAKAAQAVKIKEEVKRGLEDGDDDNSRVRKRSRPSTDPLHLELNDDDTFVEIPVAHKEEVKDIVTLD